MRWSACELSAARHTASSPTSQIPEAPQAIVGEVLSRFGRLDILVHAAGINIRKPADQITRDDYERLMRVNVESAFFLAQAAAPVMRTAGRGRIIARRFRCGGNRDPARLGVRDEQGRPQADGEVAGAGVGTETRSP